MKIVSELMKYNTKYRNYRKFFNFFQPAQTDKAQSSQFSECTENTVNQSSHLLNYTENVTFEQKCVKENAVHLILNLLVTVMIFWRKLLQLILLQKFHVNLILPFCMRLQQMTKLYR